ncbi:MAG: Mrp/NBP35 family ATP-binding protein [Bacteroidota bacterium]
MTSEDILKALSVVIDPDFKKDIVTLHMVRNIQIENNHINFDLVLTTPACPLKEQFRKQCTEAILTSFPDARVLINMTSETTSIRSNEINILPNVKNIICISSGKGGVGKSTVAVNLAYTLQRMGAKVGLLDADIHGPSIPHMLGIKNVKPEIRDIKGKHYMVPIEKDGLKVLSIGLIVDEYQALVWRGPMVTSALKQFITDTLWGKLDYLILDMPPGTGDVHITMTQTVPLTGVVIVSTPQQIAVADARKAIAMYRLQNVNVPILGLIENMAYFTPAELPDNKYYVFGKGGARQLAEEYEISFLGEIPLIQSIMEGAEKGLPASEEFEVVDTIYKEIAGNIARNISIKNEEKLKEQSTIPANAE